MSYNSRSVVRFTSIVEEAEYGSDDRKMDARDLLDGSLSAPARQGPEIFNDDGRARRYRLWHRPSLLSGPWYVHRTTAGILHPSEEQGR